MYVDGVQSTVTGKILLPERRQRQSSLGQEHESDLGSHSETLPAQLADVHCTLEELTVGHVVHQFGRWLISHGLVVVLPRSEPPRPQPFVVLGGGSDGHDEEEKKQQS
ncbi:hypothetical protein BHE74_00040538 [Ensete ventricosum]|uniref:Uncharacterized protein n=1 Tax=Ensete ventricosum TaxID=4639 RepID=A0A426ZK28_ENSVE|nr:hypothetical protein B296_00006559 [Ensete ventricosum]RWW53012.1 hypothetical protein BHE74_00040538 [Ensete ventricosum]